MKLIIFCLGIACLFNSINIYLMLKRIEKLERNVIHLEAGFIEMTHRRSIEDVVKEYTDEMSD